MRYPLAAVGGFALSAAITAPLSPDLGLTVGSWVMISVYSVYGALLARTDLQERRLPDALTLTLAAFLTGTVLALAITAGAGGAAIWPLTVSFAEKLGVSDRGITSRASEPQVGYVST